MADIPTQLRVDVQPRDPGPLQTLLHSWAARRGKRERLPFAQERLLDSINEMPCLNRSQRTRLLGWSAKKFQNARDCLEQIDYVRTETIARGAGRPDTFLALTDKAFSYLKRLRIQPNRLHGSFEHHCSILDLARHYEFAGYDTQTLAELPGGLIVDLLCTHGNDTVAVEVVCSDNLHRDAKKAEELAERVTQILFVSTTLDLHRHYAAKLPDLVSPSIHRMLSFAQRDQLLAYAGDTEEGL